MIIADNKVEVQTETPKKAKTSAKNTKKATKAKEKAILATKAKAKKEAIKQQAIQQLAEERSKAFLFEDDVKWETRRGRPPSFDEDYVVKVMEDEIAEHIQNLKEQGNSFEFLELRGSYGDKDNMRTELRGKPYTTLEDVALMAGIDVDTLIRNVGKKNKDGSPKYERLQLAYNRFMQMNKSKLIRGGLSGAYNSNVVAFVGNVNYGMIPNQKLEQSIEVKSMDKIYEELDKVYSDEEGRLEQQKQAMQARKALLDEMGAE